MSKFIAGRPFAVDGGLVEPGDELTKAQVESIPYLESFIHAGYIYVVYTAKDYDRLPPHIFTAVMTRQEAELKVHQKDGVAVEEAIAAQERGDEDESRKLAAAQVTQQEILYANVKVANKGGRQRTEDGELVTPSKTEDEPVEDEAVAEEKAPEEPVKAEPKPRATRRTASPKEE